MIWKWKTEKWNELSEMKCLVIKAMKEKIQCACKNASLNNDLLSDTVKVKPQMKNVDEWSEDKRSERWYGDEKILSAESGDQRSAKKEKITRDETCEEGMFQDTHETENERRSET